MPNVKRKCVIECRVEEDAEAVRELFDTIPASEWGWDGRGSHSPKDGSVWFLAFDGDTLAGACCAIISGEVALCKSDFVFPKYRGQGVYRRIFEERMAYLRATGEVHKVRAYAAKASLKTFQDHGFITGATKTGGSGDTAWETTYVRRDIGTQADGKLKLSGMRIFNGKSVLEAALDRIRYIFSEFPEIVVAISGGKDSTTCFRLCLQVAQELGRTPLKVMFLDQESEYPYTVEQVRHEMGHPDVEPMWFQVPFKLGSGISIQQRFFHPWEPGAKWLRDKEPGAYTENVYKEERFKKLFDAIFKYHFPGQKVARIGGVRCEESPNRRLALTVSPTYKWITWGAHCRWASGPEVKDHYLFYPIYDWSYSDVWKYIHEGGWKYNELYDLQYQKGVSIRNMRVSSLIHETAISSIFYLHETHPAFFSKLCERIPGVKSAATLKGQMFGGELPYMFVDWREYCRYLLDHLIQDPAHRASFEKIFHGFESSYDVRIPEIAEGVYRAEVHAILVGDFEGTTLDNYRVSGYRESGDDKHGKA